MSQYGKILSWIAISLMIVACVFAVSVKKQRFSKVFDTLYGKFEVTDPLVLELIRSQGMQRIKKVHQYGVLQYATPIEGYSRYDHSIGVYALLRRFGAPHPEQIAGLIHDTSHTTFSRVGDFVFNTHLLEASHKDDIHSWWIRQSDIAPILEHYGYSPDTLHYEHPDFKALEQRLPSLCADRIDYNLQGGWRRGLLNKEEVDTILSNLRYDAPHWYFIDIESAKKLGRISLNMTENLWGSSWGLLIYQWVAEALSLAMSSGVITVDDFHFSTDDVIWDKLFNTTDPLIKERVERVINYEKQFSIASHDDCDLVIKGKFRGINPLIMTNRGLRPLTEVDEDYALEYRESKEKMEKGWPVKLAANLQSSSKENKPKLPGRPKRRLSLR